MGFQSALHKVSGPLNRDVLRDVVTRKYRDENSVDSGHTR